MGDLRSGNSVRVGGGGIAIADAFCTGSWLVTHDMFAAVLLGCEGGCGGRGEEVGVLNLARGLSRNRGVVGSRRGSVAE